MDSKLSPVKDSSEEDKDIVAHLIEALSELISASELALGAIPPQCAITREILENAIRKAYKTFAT